MPALHASLAIRLASHHEKRGPAACCSSTSRRSHAKSGSRTRASPADGGSIGVADSPAPDSPNPSMVNDRLGREWLKGMNSLLSWALRTLIGGRKSPIVTVRPAMGAIKGLLPPRRLSPPPKPGKASARLSPTVELVEESPHLAGLRRLASKNPAS